MTEPYPIVCDCGATGTSDKGITHHGEECRDGCQSCHGDTSGASACPHASEIGGYDKLCNCCEDCRYQCAMDI